MFWVAMFLACTGERAPEKPDTDKPVDTGIPWPEDTGPEGTDDDGDGWTLEEGDCNDADILVNPAREETPDGQDNDCDGRVDEQFSGIVALQLGDGTTTPHKIVGVNPLGETTFEVVIQSADVVPYFLTWGVNGGWVVGDFVNAALYAIDENGGVTELANFEESLTGVIYGLSTHPDGYYLVTTFDSLQRVDPATGETTEMASFLVDPSNPEESDLWLYAFDATVDYSTGDVGIIGLYGGLAIWRSDTETVDTLWQLDPEADGPEYMIWSGNHRDNGGWYVGGQDIEGWGMFRFNEAQGTWVRRTSWDEQWSPHFMTVDGDSGDFYLTTEGGQYPYIWKVQEDGSEQAVFYPDAGTLTPGISWWDLYCVY